MQLFRWFHRQWHPLRWYLDLFIPIYIFVLIVFRKLNFLFATGQNVMCYVLLWRHVLGISSPHDCLASILSSSITEVYVTSYQKLIIYEGLNAPIIVEG